MNWSVIMPLLLRLFTEAAVDQVTSPGGIVDPLLTPEWTAEWAERTADFINPNIGVRLTLKITSITQILNDDYRYEEHDTGTVAGAAASGETDLYLVICQLRRMVIQVTAYSVPNDDTNNALVTMERIRTRTSRQKFCRPLMDMDIDYTDATPTRDMTATVNGRRMSVASIDFTFTMAVNDLDPDPVGYIAVLDIGGALTDSTIQQVITSGSTPDGEKLLDETIP